MERRKFLARVAASGIACSLTNQGWAEGQQSGMDDADKLPRITSPGTRKGDMLYRELGKTGVQVSTIGMGGFHIGKPKLQESDSIKLIHSGIDRGITFMDNSSGYNEGAK